MQTAIIWGIRNNPSDFFDTVEEKYEIVGWVDRNKDFHNTYIKNKKVYSPEEVETLTFDKVIVGAALYSSTRPIVEDCLNRGITRENIVTEYVLTTKKMKLREIFMLQHREGEPYTFENFIRINLLIHYAFVEQYYGRNTIGYHLAERYMKLVCDDGREDNHQQYFEELINNIEKNGFSENSYISLNREGCLIDGTHRLALLLWNRIEETEADILNTVWNIGEGSEAERGIEWFEEKKDSFSKRDIEYLKTLYYDLKRKWSGEAECERKPKVDLWKNEKI